MRYLFFRAFPLFLFTVILIAGYFPRSAHADETVVPLASLKGKSGAFVVSLADRSPLSKPSEIAKRIAITERQQGPDYDLSREVFDAYIPKTPAANGKFGLMVMLCFKDAGHPPDAWPAILEKNHLIWLGARKSGDERPAGQKIGLLLDEVHNARKAFPIDDQRIYLFAGSAQPPTSGLALYYPDVFSGALCYVQWFWYADIHVGRQIFKAQLPRPKESAVDLARNRGRFFLAQRGSDVWPGKPNLSQLVLTQGYREAGFKYAAMAQVPDNQMQHFEKNGGDWFEKGIEFLDAPLASLSAETPKSELEGPKTSSRKSQEVSQARSNSGTSEAAANQALALAKSYIAAQRYDLARQHLEKVISDYSNTSAAGQAKQLLAQIAGK